MQRLPGPHGDLPEIEFEPLGFERRGDEVVFADRGAANRDKDIGPAAGAGERENAFRFVLGDAERHGLATVARNERGKPGRHGRDDLIGRKVRSGRHDLVPGGEDRNLRLAANRQVHLVHGRGKHQLARAEPRARGKQHLAFGEILSARADMGHRRKPRAR